MDSSEHNPLAREQEPSKPFTNYSGPVESISLDGITVQWYANVAEAATKAEVFEKGIKRCIKGDRITYGGFKWRRTASLNNEHQSVTSSTSTATTTRDPSMLSIIGPDKTEISEPPVLILKTGVSIECMTAETGIVRKEANFSIERIQTVLRKQQQKSAGFYWRFYDENRINDSSHLLSIEKLLSYKKTSSSYSVVLPVQKKRKITNETHESNVISSSLEYPQSNGTSSDIDPTTNINNDDDILELQSL
jgi:hypothetical protein